jgi:hypothetical protein
VFYGVSGPDPSITSCFHMFGALWFRWVGLSRAWGVLAIKIVPKGSLSMSLFVTFSIKKRPPERDGSQVAFSLFFCCFLEGPTLDPLAPAQSKHSLPFSAWPLTGCRLYCISGNISRTFGVDIS